MSTESKSPVFSLRLLVLALMGAGPSSAFFVSACSGNAESDAPDDALNDDDAAMDDDVANPGADDDIEMPISGTETDNPVSSGPPPSPPVTPSQFCEESGGVSVLDLGEDGAEFDPVSTLYPDPRGLVVGPDGLYVVAEDSLWRVDEDGTAEQVLTVEQPTVDDASFGKARTQLFFADLEGSGESAIIVGHSNHLAGFSVFREEDDGYERVFQSTTPDDPAGVAVADFTGDDLPDMAAVPGGRVLLWRNEGDYAFSEEATPVVELNWAAHAIFAHDVDDDGDQDIVAVYSITA